MKKTRTNAQLHRCQLNTGQIEWLPKNPRQWDSDDLDRTVRSINEDPDYLEDRPLLAVPNGDKLIVFAGNLRLSALRKTEFKTAPVVIYEPETDEDQETVKRRAMKDNGSFGSWDWDSVANEWDDLPLDDWGINVPDEWSHGLDASSTDEQATATEDDFDEATDEILVRCNKGDVWQLGEHRLMCGDSTDPATVKALMGGGDRKSSADRPTVQCGLRRRHGGQDEDPERLVQGRR